MSWVPDFPAVANATFTVLEGTGAGGAPFAVQFNPASLEYVITNEFDNRNGNNGARQFVKKSSAKLTMTLVFDTTTTGASVRDVTANIAGLLEPARSGTKKYAPKVEFGWGSYSFAGVVEQFKETIDFFSADGVPLRSSINLTLASQTVEFQSNRSPSPAVDRASPPEPVATGAEQSPAGVANQLGDPRAARSIAAASGAQSLRSGTPGGLAVGGEVTLSAAADFSAGTGGGLGLGVSGGIGIGGGISGGIGGGIGASASAGLSLGGSAAVLSATAGPAFAELRVSPPSVSVSVGDARAALLSTGAGGGSVSFGLGGRAVAQGGGSLSADVGAGATASLHGRIGFGD